MRRRRPFQPRIEQLESRVLMHAGPLASDVSGGAPHMAQGEAGDSQVADFHLLDVNESSATFNQRVSPRDYLGQVTGWYFGHAT
jgi:hypothetical protein